MIEVTYDRSRLRIQARGHAKATRNEYGHDLVCCAVSTIVQGYGYAGMRSGHVMEMDMESGMYYTQIDPDTTPGKDLPAYFDGAVWALKMVAEYYPQHVRVTPAGGALIDG